VPPLPRLYALSVSSSTVRGAVASRATLAPPDFLRGYRNTLHPPTERVTMNTNSIAMPSFAGTVATSADLCLALRGTRAFRQFLRRYSDSDVIAESNNPGACPVQKYVASLGVEEALVNVIAITGFVYHGSERVRLIAYPEGKHRAWIDRLISLIDAESLATRTPDGDAARRPITAGQVRAYLSRIAAEAVCG